MAEFDQINIESKLENLSYRCHKCQSFIEIISLNEDPNKIEYKCSNKNCDKKEISLKNYFIELENKTVKKINDDKCEFHNQKFLTFCFDCKVNLCKECLLTYNHINHKKINIIEIMPQKHEMDIFKQILEYYSKIIKKLQNRKSNLIEELNIKIKNEKKNKCRHFQVFENKIKKELNINYNNYLEDIKKIKIKYEKEIKRRKIQFMKTERDIYKKFKLLIDKQKVIFNSNIKHLKSKADEEIKNIIDPQIENKENIQRISYLIYNTYKSYNNNYYNAININNMLLFYSENKNIKNEKIKKIDYIKFLKKLLFRKYTDENLIKYIIHSFKKEDLPFKVIIKNYNLHILREKYNKIIESLKKNKENILYGIYTENDWENGLCEKKEEPKVYIKYYEVKEVGEFLSRKTIKLKKCYKDIIVGWKIRSCWRDGTNGSWELKENPILKKNIEIVFTSQLFRGEHFEIKLFLMKYPE